MLQVDTNWHWFTISRATLVGIAMGCGDDFRPRSGQPVSDAALCAQTLGLRKLRRSVTRLKAQVALRFAPLRRWRSLHCHGAAPPAPPDASLVTPCSVPPSASWNLRALPNSGGESASLKCSHNQLRSASCPLRGSGRNHTGVVGLLVEFCNSEIVAFDDIPRRF